MISKTFGHMGNALQTSLGWIIALCTMFATFIEPEKSSFIVVGFAVFADLFWGIAAAIKLKKFFLSTALRDTVKKIGIYSFTLLGALSVETIVHAEGTFVAIRTIAVIAAVCELWSMSASMLIVYPNMPFLRIFQEHLKGEIESKLSKNVNIDDFFKEERRKSHKQKTDDNL